MRVWLAVSVVIGCPLLTSLALGQDTRTWAFSDGHWTDVPRTPTTEPVVDEPAIDEAEQLLFHGDYHTAKKILLAWEKTHKKSPARDRCIFLLAEVFFQSDNRIKSFYYCDELMDEYPSSPLFQAALQKQFDIAAAYLGGYKDRFLFMRILDEGAEAVEMMWRIQQRAPGSPLAEKAMLRTADYYFADQEYDLAEDVYNAYARTYPNSPEIPRVKLQAAFSSLAQFRGVKFDATNIIDARTQLLEIQKKYPDMAVEENVATLLDQIDSAFARKILEQGEFYERTYEIRGAVYEYRFLAQVYPTSPEAAEARQHLSGMPPYALAEAAPPPASGYAPVPTPNPSATPGVDAEAK
jgi:outer membrane protein assembly factor BamD (BamD/ComL family)